MKTTIIVTGILCFCGYLYLLWVMVEFMFHEHKKVVKPIDKNDFIHHEEMNKLFKDMQDLIEKTQPKRHNL